MWIVAHATYLVPNLVEKITVSDPIVIPSEVEESRRVAFEYFCGLPRLRFASLEMTETL